MGIRTVAVYSEADKDALHTQLADEAVCIGPAPSAESYLNMQNIISATLVSGADAIHPGFGFLSENCKFAELCEQCKITYIGPDSKVISALGNKSVGMIGSWHLFSKAIPILNKKYLISKYAILHEIVCGRIPIHNSLTSNNSLNANPATKLNK